MDSTLLNESELIEIISKLNPLQQMMQQNLQGKSNILLLLGDTGVGKSTLFNWINGAEFEMKKGRHGIKQLVLKNEDDDNFSKQNGGMVSVTSEPKFFYNEEYNHIVIDFPGFKDTQGAKSELLIKLMFQDILQFTKVKLCCVTLQKDEQLQERGAGLRELVQRTFSNANVKIGSICLVLNQFLGTIGVDELLECIQSQLQELSENATDKSGKEIFLALQKNIYVQMKVNPGDDVSMQKFLSQKNKSKFWNVIAQTTPVSYTPSRLEYGDQVSNYISKKINSYIQEIIKEQESQYASTNTIEQMEKLIQIIKDKNQQLDKIQNQNDVVNDFEKIYTQFKSQIITKEFILIFNFFKKYKKQIPAYIELDEQFKILLEAVKIFLFRLQEKLSIQKEQELMNKKLEDTGAQLEKQGQKIVQQDQQMEKQQQQMKEQENQMKSQEQKIVQQEQSIKQQQNQMNEQQRRQERQIDQLQHQHQRQIDQQQQNFQNQLKQTEQQSKKEKDENTKKINEILKNQQNQKIAEMQNYQLQRERELQQENFALNKELRMKLEREAREAQQKLAEEYSKKLEEKEAIIKKQKEEAAKWFYQKIF